MQEGITGVSEKVSFLSNVKCEAPGRCFEAGGIENQDSLWKTLDDAYSAQRKEKTWHFAGQEDIVMSMVIR